METASLDERFEQLQHQEKLSWDDTKGLARLLTESLTHYGSGGLEEIRSIRQRLIECSHKCHEERDVAAKERQQREESQHEWQQLEREARASLDKLRFRVKELETREKQITNELEKLRAQESSAKERLEDVKTRLAETEQELTDYEVVNEDDIPEAKHQISLYASATGIKFDTDGGQTSGQIYVPTSRGGRILDFAIEDNLSEFQVANALWDKVNEAFGDREKH